MIDRILSFSIRQRWLVMFVVLGIAAFGAWSFTRLPIDAVPDITNVQVQINTTAAGYSPLEIEQRITFPIETAMGGLPRLEYTRSLSRYGLSQVTVVFLDGTDIYFARQLVNERIQQVKDQLPPGVETAMGPVSTGLGEIFQFAVEARPDAKNAEGRAVLDHRASHDPGLDHQAAAAHGSGRRRGEHDRRLRAAIPRAAGSGAADGLQAVVPRRDDGAGRQQRQRRRRLHRAQRRAVPRPHAGAGCDHRRDQGHRHRLQAGRADPHCGYRLGRGRQRAPHGRRLGERRGDRRRHRHAADRREQPRGGPARRPETEGHRGVAARGRDRPARSTTARCSSRRPSRPSKRTCSKARCWSSWCSFSCSATSAPRSQQPSSFRCRC